MKHFKKSDIQQIENNRRANLINSTSGYKPANLIGTISAERKTNLAIFSSVVHLGSNPPLLGFITRPVTDAERHTYSNIMETGVYTINHVHSQFIENAHFTSAKFERKISEFKACGLSEEYVHDFRAPFVQESKVKIGLRFIEEIPIKINGTILMIGEIEHLILPENAIRESGNIDLNLVDNVCISGLDTYHEVKEIAVFPFARPNQMPQFD